MESGTRNLRLFLALEPSDTVREWLASLQRRIRRDHPDSLYRWVAPQNLHVTLHFLGDTLAERVPVLSAAMKKSSGGVQPFRITAEGLGFFPNERRPRVLWCGIAEGARQIAGLYRTLGEALSHADFTLDRRPFHPHFTLAYVRKNAERNALRESASSVAAGSSGTSEPMEASRVVLMQSTLTPQGSIYTPLSTVELGRD